MPSQTITEVLQGITFGQRIAEEESDALTSYFVETNQWSRIFSGEIDIVYGPKGSGKSAIYFLLLSKARELLERNTIIVAAENPRGAPAFKDLVADPPTSEAEFKGLWKLYLLSLVAEQIRAQGFASDSAKYVVLTLEEAGLLEPSITLSRRIRVALDYVRKILKFESVEGTLHLDPSTGLPIGIGGRITLREPRTEEREAGLISADDLFAVANEALVLEGLSGLPWIA